MRPSDLELRAGLERALGTVDLELLGEIERRPSPYRTSFPIEEVQLDLVGRGKVKLAFKRLDWEELDTVARLAKPRFLHNPEREPESYRMLLERAPAGPPEYFGSVRDGTHSWLFVEWVEGRELFQVGELSLWKEAARWLGRFHAQLAGQQGDRFPSFLIDHDASFYRRWMERAKEFAGGAQDGRSGAALAWLGERHEHVVEALQALPRTVIHGEFYASNVLVAGTSEDARVAPVDWELAAAAPGLTDLAALVSGWSPDEREALVEAYSTVPGVPSFGSRELDFARLQVAIQWLGWAPPEWDPPAGQRHDWLAEAVALAEGLGL